MERKKNSRASHKWNGSGYSILNFPEEMLVDILLKLAIKEIIMCKSVCKTWHHIISDCEFTELHFARAQASALIRPIGPTHIARLLYLFNPLERAFGYCKCDDFNSSHGCNANIKLDSKVQIPLRNADIVQCSQMLCNGDSTAGGTKRNRCMKLKPRDHKLKIVNSCRGLLCLSEPYLNDPIIVCNPVTAEYIDLPNPKDAYNNSIDHFDCGFGFSPKSNQYKVIRMFRDSPCPFVRCPLTGAERYASRLAEVHTLGTSSWRHVGYAPVSICMLAFPTYLNGAIHWFFIGSNSECSDFIISFDFEKEKFQAVPTPPVKDGKIEVNDMRRLCMGVIMDCLCICDATYYHPVDMWVMKKYGERESWTKMFSIDNLTGTVGLCGLYHPITYTENGTLVMFNSFRSVFIYYDTNKRKVKLLRVQGVKSKFEAVAYTPSFISLEEALIDDDEVITITSRRSELKLPGETKGIYLVQEKKVNELDIDVYAEGDEDWKRYWARTEPARKIVDDDD